MFDEVLTQEIILDIINKKLTDCYKKIFKSVLFAIFLSFKTYCSS